jgi:polyribonucleotide nucleotidyltransferase
MHQLGSDITKQVARQIADMSEGITACQTAQLNLNSSHGIMRDTLKKLQEGRDQHYSTMENTLKKERANYIELATGLMCFRKGLSRTMLSSLHHEKSTRIRETARK